jgi:hypothetical protein
MSILNCLWVKFHEMGAGDEERNTKDFEVSKRAV